MTKTCSKCGEDLPLEAFRKRGDGHTYRSESSARQSYCKKCEKRYYRTRGKENRWTRLAWNLRRHNKGSISATELREGIGDPSTCYLCGDPVGWADSELDHVVPLSRGGRTDIPNLSWAHRKCNRLKHDLMVPELVELMSRIAANLADKE